MKQEPITLHAVHQGDDDRNCGRPVWFYTSKLEADNVAKGRGWYGSEAPTSTHFALLIDGEYWLLARHEPIKVNSGPNWEEEGRKKALSKLTKEEIQLLGLE